MPIALTLLRCAGSSRTYGRSQRRLHDWLNSHNLGREERLISSAGSCHSVREPRARENYQASKPNYWRQAMANGWTPERRARQAGLIRDWKQWERSTGPHSDEGKARTSRNGFKGGLPPPRSRPCWAHQKRSPATAGLLLLRLYADQCPRGRGSPITVPSRRSSAPPYCLPECTSISTACTEPTSPMPTL